MAHLRKAALAAIATLLGAACVGPDIDYGETVTFEIDDVDVGDYIIAPGDRLDIRFSYHQNQDIVLTVRPDGKIAMPFAEEVVAAGLTVDQLDEALEAKVGERLKDADLAIVVQQFTLQRIFIAGEVLRPGEQPLMAGMTAQRALAAAGWIRPTAEPEAILVIRVVSPGKAQAFKLDLSEDQLIANDMGLKPYDLIYVPKSGIARVGEWVNQYLERTVPSWVRSVIVATAIRESSAL